ncbi:MAG: hypothetical protein ABIP56_05040 [Dokdonella sp.]
MKFVFCAAAMLLSLPCLVNAGSRVTYRGIDGGSSSTVLVGANRMRIDADGETRVIIDPRRASVLVLHLSEREYTRLDDPTLQRLTAQVNATLSQLDDVLSNMPQELRGSVGELMGKAGAGAGLDSVSLVNTGRAETASGQPCVVWRNQRAGETVGEACIGGIGAWDLERADRTTVEASLSLLQAWSRQLQKGALSRYFKATTFPIDQVPFRVTQFDAGRRSTSEFSGSDRIDVSKDDFQLPVGFRERPIELPALGR